ncbi:SRPBCC family protein [Microbacterium sp.]|uniref:SRPBCC family protein n=1 Tax=Microbacterium sp. TaxID=51671 RepID=UPI0039E385BF
MPTRTLLGEFALAASAHTVFDHVRDPQSYVGLSPLVVSVGDIEEIADGYRYRAVERVPIVAGWTVDNPLVVTLFARHEADAYVVHGEVVSPGGIRVWYRYDITADGEGCRVRDEVVLRTPWGLGRFAAARARAVQLARPSVLAQRLTPIVGT